jgi:surface protein
MRYVFRSAFALTTLNLSGWDISSVTDMTGIFRGTTNLNKIIYNTTVSSTSIYSTFLDKMYNLAGSDRAVGLDFIYGNNDCYSDSTCTTAKSNLETNASWVFKYIE